MEATLDKVCAERGMSRKDLRSVPSGKKLRKCHDDLTVIVLCLHTAPETASTVGTGGPSCTGGSGESESESNSNKRPTPRGTELEQTSSPSSPSLSLGDETDLRKRARLERPSPGSGDGGAAMSSSTAAAAAAAGVDSTGADQLPLMMQPAQPNASVSLPAAAMDTSGSPARSSATPRFVASASHASVGAPIATSLAADAEAVDVANDCDENQPP